MFSPFNVKVFRLDLKKITHQLQAKDATLWSEDPDVQTKIRNRLGWLDCVDRMQTFLPEIEDFVASVRSDFDRIILLGMGGSGLASEVFAATFGSATGYPDLTVVATTDPATILKIDREFDLAKTLFIVSTKSGNTIETLCLFQYFYQRLDKKGDHFIAITDPASNLEKIADECCFRQTFLNPVDIGGRYSALSYFGLVPAGLIGVDLHQLWNHAKQVDIDGSVEFGVQLAAYALAGRDKLTLLVSPKLSAFGYWIEQLIAESTGKQGKGIVPIEGERIADPSYYEQDRVFVYIRFNDELDDQIRNIERSGLPVIQIEFNEICYLGREFFRWEIAIAISGAIMQLNPFDEPNVTESKRMTEELLAAFPEGGKLPEETLAFEIEQIKIYINSSWSESATGSISEWVEQFLGQARLGIDYIVVLAYIPEDKETLQSVQMAIRDRFKIATTIGYGPRYLHSTGQLHKGGFNNGVFLLITVDDLEDVEIPRVSYSFSKLKMAQAFGDLRALCRKDRRIARVHISGDLSQGLEKLKEMIAP